MCRAWRPEIHHYDPALFALVMEQLSPHIIMRRGLIEGRRYPDAARHVGDYIARASFFTSDLAIPLEQKFAGVADFANNLALRRITAELVFTDPYRVMERNRWTSPELDDVAARIRADGPLKIAAARRGHQFLASSQALIHGDLHTGSVMVTESDTRVIDPEFAVYGPIGFDLGAFLANLLMSYYSQPGHALPKTTAAACSNGCSSRCRSSGRALPSGSGCCGATRPAATPIRKTCSPRRPTRPRSPPSRSASSPSCSPTWSALPAPRSSAAFSASRTMPISN